MNGTRIASAVGGQLTGVVGDLVVGKGGSTDTAFEGYFDELRWYTVARTAEEICKDAAGTWSGTDCK